MRQARIRFRHLQTFLEVARQHSVSQAAEVLHVSQPAVTKTIRELEHALETKLLEKDGRGIRVTRQGEVFLRYAGTSVAAIRQGIDSLSLEKNGPGPTLRVGALPTVSARVMPQAVRLFLEAGDRRTIRVVSGDNLILLNQLRTGDLDLVVGRLAAPEQMTGLSFEHLYSEQIVFVARKSHPLLSAKSLDFSRIADFPVLMPPPGSIIRPFVDRLLISHGMATLPRVVETVSDAFGRAFVEQDDAVWIISEGVVAREIGEGRLCKLSIDTSETLGSVGLTTRADSEISSHVQLLISMIREAAGTQG